MKTDQEKIETLKQLMHVSYKSGQSNKTAPTGREQSLSKKVLKELLGRSPTPQEADELFNV
jgi:hypothetical protein